jgi:bifunctional non-homologous end joining protein LigD
VAEQEVVFDGRMRHPSFAGLREDEEASEVKRERPQDPPAPRRAATSSREPGTVAGVRISHPERVVFQRSGHSGPWVPRSVQRVSIQEKTRRADYLMVDSVEALVGLVQMNVIELHTWNARASDLERPDRIVFDLDPGPGVAWAQVAAAAATLRERLEALDLECFAKTTGGKGAHVVVPLQPRAGWDECVTFSRAVSEGLERDRPEAFLTDMAKARRAGRILIDYARNHRGSTSVAAFSPRSRPQAPVSLPVSWEELPRLAGGDAFTVQDVERMLRERRADPWAAYGRRRQALTASRLQKANRL